MGTVCSSVAGDGLFQPSPERAVLLHADHDGSPWLEVYQQADIRWLGFDGPAVQSAMSVARPDRLVLPYTRAMLLSLLFTPRPQRLLNLGLGGGSFNRFFSKHEPEFVVTTVERDQRVLEIARHWFLLDAGQSCVIDSAQRYLAGEDQRHDLILCDLHGGDGIPEELLEPGFYRACFTKMNGGAVLAINILPESEAELSRLMHAARESFASLALVEVADHRNIVVFAVAGRIPPHEKLAARMSALQRRWDLELDVYFDTIRMIEDPVR